jgi:hypothetical protein
VEQRRPACCGTAEAKPERKARSAAAGRPKSVAGGSAIERTQAGEHSVNAAALRRSYPNASLNGASLFVTQRQSRINSGCATGGDIDGEERHAAQRRRRDRERHRIGGSNPK